METNTKPVSKIKRIVAREGLIILGILAVAGLCGLTGTLIRAAFPEMTPEEALAKIRQMSAQAETKKKTNESDKPTADELLGIKPKITGLDPAKIEEARARRRAALVIDPQKLEEARARRRLSAELVAKREAYLNWAGNFEAAGVFILFLAYPLYLLVRFVVWAIRTLRS